MKNRKTHRSKIRKVITDRKGLEEEIRKKAKRGGFPCAVSFKISEEFGISNKEMGEILNEMKVKINQRQLGCFE